MSHQIPKSHGVCKSGIRIRMERKEVESGRTFSGKHYRKHVVITLKLFFSLWSIILCFFHSSTMGKKPTGCHSFDDHLSSNQDGGKSKNVVNLGAIRQGMKRFQFLLNCCEPGTIPDASILAAALDLVSCWKNLPTLSPIITNTANGGKHESPILKPYLWSFVFFFF